MIEGTDWTTIIVALISASAGSVVPIALHLSGKRRDRKSVSASIIAEVVSLLQLASARGYVAMLDIERQNLALRLSGASVFGQTEVAPAVFRLPVPENYNLIYRENASKIGYLMPSDAIEVVKFYQLIQSVLADVSEGGFLYQGTRDLRQMDNTIVMLEEALEIGRAFAAKA